MKKYTLFAAAVFAYALTVASANANTFTNGGFESGDFTGWTQQGGYWSYYGGGYNLGATAPTNAIMTTPGTDALTNNNLNTVYAGNHSARINNSVNDYSVSTVKQSVTNYTDNNMFFEWAAVLESSHGSTDSDHFRLTLTDDTTNTIIVDREYNSYDKGAIFKQGAGNGWGTYWYYTDWQVEQIDLVALGAVGHNFTLELLASDCPYGGHAGYVYLDGFAPIIIPPGPDPVPEPGTFALLGLGLAGLGLARRRMKK